MAFEALKEKQSVAWGSGPYEQVSVQHIGVLEDLLNCLDLHPGLHLLDVATGTGELARPAARRGLVVTASDFAESLIATARALTTQEGLTVEYDVNDAEALPYEDGMFDVVTSTFGVMFAPDHHAVAHELARVTKHGGNSASLRGHRMGGSGRCLACSVRTWPRRPMARVARLSGVARNTCGICWRTRSTSTSPRRSSPRWARAARRCGN